MLASEGGAAYRSGVMTPQNAPIAPPPPTPPAAPPPVPAAGGQDRFLLAIVGGTLLLVLVSVIIVFTVGRARPAPNVDPNSPAGVVQSYVEAIRAGDVEKARGYLTRQAQIDSDTRQRQNPLRPNPDDRMRIVVETVSATDTTADVKLTISHFYGRNDPFSAGTSHRDTTVRLVREDGVWKISQPPQAYELT